MNSTGAPIVAVFLSALFVAAANPACAEVTALTCATSLSPHAQHIKLDKDKHRVEQSSTHFDTDWVAAIFSDEYIRWNDDAGGTHTLDRYTGNLVHSSVTIHWHCVVLPRKF